MAVVLVTGATGLTGSNVCRQLAERGDRPRALVRNPSTARALAAVGAELVGATLSRSGTRPPSSLALDPRWSRWPGRSSPNHTLPVRWSRRRAAPPVTRRRGVLTAFAHWSRGSVASGDSAEFTWTGTENT
ncbi:SDR family oxidoreductase [Mycolicibacterium poriferae]|uniref:SDR family oxidoreductase n=1 Tax=Mycolicibacterium poriferae TaxID=39694 RepID=UPI0024B9C9FD|nr:NAD(P)H-binding protein [Mycolicibacterium poriferae]